MWDRLTDVVEGRSDARTVAVTSGGTIPDRGLFPVFLEGEAGTPGRRVGELDEEMVYELRAGMHGDVIVLGASSWRVADISPNRVTVTPAPGIPGKLPFWKGDTVGRPVDLGRQIGAFVREVEADLANGAKGRARAVARLRRDHDLDELAAGNLLAYLEDEHAATGALPTDRRIVVERFRDELGDWRLVVLTPFGGRVHAPWTLALEARLSERLGLDIQTIWSDDGIAIRLPEGDASLDGMEALLFPEPEEVEDLVVGRVGQSSLFASRFRENAARALLLPRRRPGTRTPLWQQRQRAADLLAVASRYGSFPILVETYRECLADVFDLPALREILDGVRRREVAVHSVETARASAFASSLLFDYVAAYMYDGDTPLAERRAQALTLDRDLLRELLGQEELRELLDPDALADLELSLQALADDRHADSPDHVHDLLRRLGDLSTDEVGARTVGGRVEASLHLAELAATRRAVRARIGGEERWIAIEDVARYRDGVGVAAPPGVPQAFLGPTVGALDGLLARYARTHGPFLGVDPARRWGLAAGIVEDGLHRLAGAGSLLSGEFRPGGAEREFCDPEVLRLLRRRSLARLRREVEPVDPVTVARFLPAWQGVSTSPAMAPSPPVALRGPAALERLAEVVDQLAGLPVPASVLERDVLPARIPGYQPRLLDELGAMGEVAWVGRGSLGRDDGRVVLYRPGRELLRPAGPPDGIDRPETELHERIRAHLRRRGASFYRELFGATGGRSDREVLDALWDLVWAGEVTNDTFAPLRALRWKRPARDHRPRAGRLTALGPPEAAGRWSLVAEGDPDASPVATRTERVHALALVLLERYGVVTREAVAGEPIDGGIQRRVPGAARDGGGRPHPPWVLRGRPRRSPVRAAGRGRSATGAAGPAGRARGRARTRGAPARGGGSGEPVWRGPALAASWRRRPAAVPAGGRRVRLARRWRRGPVPRAGWDVAPGAAGRRRPGDAGRGPRLPRRPRRGRPRAGARAGEGGWRAGGNVAVQRGAPGGRVRPGLSRLRPAGRPAGRADLPPPDPRPPDPLTSMPEGDTLVRMAAGLRPFLVGRPVTAASARAPGPQAARLVGATVTAVEAAGKNLLIRFDNGLEVRTHLRMHGSWHRYRPGERWRRPAGRARLVIEVEGSVAVCFDAPVVELFEERAEPAHPSLSRLGPDLLREPFDHGEAIRRLRDPTRADRSIAEALLDQRALAGIGNEVKNEVLWDARRSPWTPVRDIDDAALLDLVERARAMLLVGAATGRRPRRVHRRSGRPCPRCGTPIRVEHQGTDLPRLTFWCPPCQAA